LVFSGDREEVCLPTILSKQECMDTSSLKTSEKVVLSPTEFASLFGRHYTWGYRQIYAGKVKVGRTPFFGPEGELVSGVLLMV
jgi:hypothetical protein